MIHVLNLGFRFAAASLFIIWSLAVLVKTEVADYDMDETFNDCTQQKFNCTSGESIPMYWICDTDFDCVDGSDEDENMCKTFFQFHQPCLFQCDNGKSIRYAFRCDGYVDCEDHSDENSCPGTVAPNAAMDGQKQIKKTKSKFQ